MNEKININYDKENGKYTLIANVDTSRTILGNWLCHASKILYTQYHYLNALINILDEISKLIESELQIIHINREDEDGIISYYKPIYIDREGDRTISFGRRHTMIVLSWNWDSTSDIFISVHNRDCEPSHFRKITTYICIRIREDDWPDVCVEHHDSDDDIGQRIIDILTAEKVIQPYRIVETNNVTRDTKEDEKFINGLYRKIKEYVEGNNIKEDNNNE